MPVDFLTVTQRQQFDIFPEKINEELLIKYFTLSDADFAVVPRTSSPHHRMRFSLLLCALRYLGFFPENLSTAPDKIIQFLKKQLNLSLESVINLEQYERRAQTRSDHQLAIEKYLKFKRATERHKQNLRIWLLDRAMEHDRPTLLLNMAINKLKQDKIVRPTIVSLERLVATTREQSRHKTYQYMLPLLFDTRKAFLDNLLLIDTEKGQTSLTWLRQQAFTNSPESILTTLSKIRFLRQHGVHEWDLSALNANRLKLLSRLGKHVTNQSLQRSVIEKRYPILIAFLYQVLAELTDEVVDLFDQCLSEAYSRSKTSLKKHQEKVSETTNEKLRLLETIGTVILDNQITDPELRHEVYRQIPAKELEEAITECKNLIRPEHDKYFDFLANRFSYIRKFAPHFLKDLKFCTSHKKLSLLHAVGILRQMNKESLKKVPIDAPTNFINSSWKHFVYNNGKVDRKYYELCVLWELRQTLRSGDIWVVGGRRYNNPESYLIPRTIWSNLRPETCQLLQLSEQASPRLSERQCQLDALLCKLSRNLPHDNKVKIENGGLVISPTEAEKEPESLKKLRQLITQRLPRIDLPDLLIEVNSWVPFINCFYHAANQKSNPKEVPLYLYAAILAETTNLGATAMSNISDLEYERIVWYKNWYIREETLVTARTMLVNFQHNLELAQHFGDGTFSSSDGRRVPVAVKTVNARSFVKYFAYERGLNIYSWTSNQYPQYGVNVVPPTMREATFALDAILDNETELDIKRHTTDTAGYTEIIFALFDLMGISFDPRIKNLGDQWLYRFDSSQTYKNIDSIIKGKFNVDLITEYWDDILRVAGSIKQGWVAASLFVTKLQALPQKSMLAKALQEYGKIVKSISILRYATNEAHRREIGIQLNKGEAVHDLQQFLHLAREGRLYDHHLEEQESHVGCLNLIVNAVVIWNTVYMNAVIAQLKHEGLEIKDEDLKHIAPSRHEHINPYGRYQFNMTNNLNGKLRPLRTVNWSTLEANVVSRNVKI